jgi:hypothetical protein
MKLSGKEPNLEREKKKQEMKKKRIVSEQAMKTQTSHQGGSEGKFFVRL